MLEFNFALTRLAPECPVHPSLLYLYPLSHNFFFKSKKWSPTNLCFKEIKVKIFMDPKYLRSKTLLVKNCSSKKLWNKKEMFQFKKKEFLSRTSLSKKMLW